MLKSTHQLSKPLKNRICKTIILPFLLYGCEMWSLILKEHIMHHKCQKIKCSGRHCMKWPSAGSEVLTVLTIHSTVFWVVMSCSLQKAWCFRGMLAPSSSGWMGTPSKKPAEVAQLRPPLSAGLTLRMEVICSSEMLGFLWTIWNYNPEEHTASSG
jgi:hypothetical protein